MRGRTCAQRDVLGARIVVMLADDVLLDLAAGATVLDAAFHIDLEVRLTVGVLRVYCVRECGVIKEETI